MQQQNGVYFTSKPTESDIKQCKTAKITQKNIIEMCIYLAVRNAIDATRLNNRDQFLYPNTNREKDTEFKQDCLIFSLFCDRNNLKSSVLVNHWIPFTEDEVDAREKFASHFMVDFLKGREFSPEAASVFDA